MLHTKFRGNPPAGCGKEDFEGFLPYMYVGNLGHVTSIISINFHFHVHVPYSLHTIFGYKRHSVFRKSTF